jgi:hypothetical protein
MKVAQALQTLAVDRGREDIRFQLLSIHSSFTEVGPNGTHACLVSPVAGPNLRSTSSLAHGTFRSGLARKACKQVAEALHVMHASGYVHGGKSPCLYSCDDGMPSLRNQIFGKKIFSSNCPTGSWRLRTMLSIKHWEPHMWNILTDVIGVNLMPMPPGVLRLRLIQKSLRRRDCSKSSSSSLTLGHLSLRGPSLAITEPSLLLSTTRPKF